MQQKFCLDRIHAVLLTERQCFARIRSALSPDARGLSGEFIACWREMRATLSSHRKPDLFDPTRPCNSLMLPLGCRLSDRLTTEPQRIADHRD